MSNGPERELHAMDGLKITPATDDPPPAPTTPPDWDPAAARRKLYAQGFCHVPGVLDADTLTQVRGLAAHALSTVTPAHREAYRSEGSLVPVADFPAFSALIAAPGPLQVFARLGLGAVRFSSGYVISKPPGGPPLFWHQDWWGWDHPVSREETIAQVFAFFYLSDTRRENGCLRVIPGSHRRRHPLHDLLDAHSAALARAGSEDDTAYAPWDGEVAVPVKAGDLVVGDARLIHGAYANRSDGERTLITLWFHPDFPRLPEPIRARLTRIMLREDVDTDAGPARELHPGVWPEPHRGRVRPLLVDYDGDVAPQPWNRTPALSERG